MLTGNLMYSEKKLFILKCPHVHTNSKTVTHLKPMDTRTQYVRNRSLHLTHMGFIFWRVIEDEVCPPLPMIV
jgi:hypothetical protein